MTQVPYKFKWGGPKFRQAWSQMCKAVQDRTPLPGPNVLVDDQPGEGRMITAQAGVPSSTTTGPFQIVNVGGAQLIGVSFFSQIFKNLKQELLTIVGLLTDTPTPEDPGAFACPAIGHKIWIEIATVDPEDSTHVLQPFAASVNYGAPWEGYPDPVIVNDSDPLNPYQESYCMLIAEIVASTDLRQAIFTLTVSGQQRNIIQIAQQNVILTNWAVDGLVILVPEHWNKAALPS